LFEYLYRDASNWKQHGQAVFTNTAEIPLATIEARIRASLEGGEWFIAEMVDLETCFIGDHDTEDDHPWHEFERVAESAFPHSDPAFCGPCRDIAQFLQALENGKLRKWNQERQLCRICGQKTNGKTATICMSRTVHERAQRAYRHSVKSTATATWLPMPAAARSAISRRSRRKPKSYPHNGNTLAG
jgi:hypothetical protein